MAPTPWFATALLVAATLAAGEPIGTNATNTTATTTTMTATGRLPGAGSTSGPTTLADRVVLLMADRTDLSVWCLGLLIAPRAVLTYAHCVQSTAAPMAWAFFGGTRDDFTQWQAAQSAAEPRDGDVGDMDAWGAVVQTIVHPEYAPDGSTPTSDLAVLELQEPRVTTDVFSLVANMSELDAADAFDMQAFQLSNGFVTAAADAKLREPGTFRKVAWQFCTPHRRSPLLGSALALAPAPKGQVCAVATVVEDRKTEQLTNAFVMLEDKLVGLSVVTNNAASAAHRFILLSHQADFITKATQQTEVWAPIANSRLVVGGRDTTTLKGYVAGLRLTKSGTNFCLGSLVAPKFVLTAAHCVQGVNFSQVSVGSMYVASEVDGEQIKVKRTIVHPNYEAATFRNDYAIVELEYISIQSPILLYNGSGAETAPGKRLAFYGYGPSSGNTPGLLQSVDLPVIDKAQCKAVLQPPVLDDAMLCAGGEEGKDACKGDSGGPLVVESKLPTSLVAMASYGRGCAIKGVPAVYAVVSMAGSFIDKYVDGHRWVTAYGSDTAAPTTKAPSPSPSTPVTTRLPNTELRSAVAPSPRDAAVLDEIVTQAGWKPVPSIVLPGSSSGSLTIGDGYSQLTRDVLSVTVLSPRSSLGTSGRPERLEDLTKFAGASEMDLYSGAPLRTIASLVSAFDARSLRRRTARFTMRGSSSSSSSSAECSAHR